MNRDIFKDLEVKTLTAGTFKIMCREKSFLDNTVYKVTSFLLMSGEKNLFDPEELVLPKNLWLERSAYFSNYKIKEMPKNLKICSGLQMAHTQIILMPKNLEIQGVGDVSFIKTGNRFPSIYEIPENAHYDLTGYFGHYNRNQRLNDPDLILSYSQLKELPKGFIVTGNNGVVLFDSKLEKICENVKIEGNLNITGSRIKELPNDLIVGEELRLVETDIEVIPDSLHQFKKLHVSTCPLKKLPNDLFVDDELFLFNCKDLKELPKNLETNILIVEKCPIKEIPDTLRELEALAIRETGLERLPENMIIHMGDADLRDNKNLYELPEKFKVYGNINICGTNVYKTSATSAKGYIIYPSNYVALRRWYEKTNTPLNKKLSEEELQIRKLQIGS